MFARFMVVNMFPAFNENSECVLQLYDGHTVMECVTAVLLLPPCAVQTNELWQQHPEDMSMKDALATIFERRPELRYVKCTVSDCSECLSVVCRSVIKCIVVSVYRFPWRPELRCVKNLTQISLRCSVSREARSTHDCGDMSAHRTVLLCSAHITLFSVLCVTLRLYPVHCLGAAGWMAWQVRCCSGTSAVWRAGSPQTSTSCPRRTGAR